MERKPKGLQLGIFTLTSLIIYLISIVEVFGGFSFVGMLVHNIQKWCIFALGTLVVFGLLSDWL